MQDEERSPFELIAGYQKSLPVDLIGLARDLGIRVEWEALGDKISGQIIRNPRKGGSSGFLIVVNSEDHPNRKRFTLAHEIAHFILHRDLIEEGVVDNTMYRSAELSSYHEVQANRLAADILMPIKIVRREWLADSDPVHLARRFGVSVEAIKIRLKNLE